jgi:Tol biopolymer transport system component
VQPSPSVFPAGCKDVPSLCSQRLMDSRAARNLKGEIPMDTHHHIAGRGVWFLRRGVPAVAAAVMLAMPFAGFSASAAVVEPPALVAFASDRTGNFEIFLSDGRRTHQLTASDAFDGQPAFSPDGQRIAFVSDRSGSFEIYVMHLDGSDVTQLTFDPASWDYDPSWSPDGELIAFSSDRSGDATSLYVMNTDGSGARPVTSGTGVADVEPAFSPDGSQIAFTSDREGGWAVYVVGTDGAGLRRLTAPVEYAAFPAFSPDGLEIAFVSDASGQPDLYSMGADGTEPVALTTDAALEAYPAWSLDGTKLAFVSNASGNDEILVMDATGSVENFSDHPAVDTMPTWYPGGEGAMLPGGGS